MHYLIKDTDFEKILNFLKQVKGIHKNNEEKLRTFIEAVYYLARSGCQVRLIPLYYSECRAIHKRFKVCSDRGIRKSMFEYFKQDPDMKWIMIDSTVVRAHACAAGYGKNSQSSEALGRSKGGFSTKIHILTDALGNHLKFLLTPGKQNDIIQAKHLCKDVSKHIWTYLMVASIMKSASRKLVVFFEQYLKKIVALKSNQSIFLQKNSIFDKNYKKTSCRHVRHS